MSLGYFEIKELGNHISHFLEEKGIKSHSDLVINVNKDTLHKIDEDIYYRINPQGKDFQMSDEEINVEFKNLTIQIKANDE